MLAGLRICQSHLAGTILSNGTKAKSKVQLMRLSSRSTTYSRLSVDPAVTCISGRGMLFVGCGAMRSSVHQESNVAFIASLGALLPRRSQPLLAVLRDRLRSLKWSGGDAAASNLIVTSCFVGSVEALSWSNFLSACGVSEGDCRLIFPSYRDVYETDETDGWNKMHLFVGKEATHGTMTHLDTLLHRAVLRDRRALWHIKMYCRFPSDRALEAATQGSGTLAWVLLGSHNCSEASFGTLTQGGNNVEASVLMSTSRSDTAREWRRRHPFDLAACVRYKGRYTRHSIDDEIYTWGRSPFMFSERYGHGQDDRGDASWHSLDQLKKMKEIFYTERRNERSR